MPDDDDGAVVMMTRGHNGMVVCEMMVRCVVMMTMVMMVTMTPGHNGWLVVSGIYELCSLTHTVEPFPLSLSFYIWGMDGNDDDTVLMTIVA